MVAKTEDNDRLVVVCGAGGFIGGHMVARLLKDGWSRVRAVDVREPSQWDQRHAAAENMSLDLSIRGNAAKALAGAHHVYNLAADMGGMGFIETNRAACMLNVLINTHLLMAAKDAGVAKFFFASSACVYPDYRQKQTDVPALREADAYPAMPEDGYGWEKLFSERMCRHFMEDFGLPVRVARFHNVYGPHGTFEGGREKAPAAVCRKVLEAKRVGRHEIEIWGDGSQTRSFMYVDDCVEGVMRLMNSDVSEPLNIGSDQLVSINGLVDIVEGIAGLKLARSYKLDAPKGVRGRNSDNTLIRARLGWAPSIRLEDGMTRLYRWIESELANR